MVVIVGMFYWVFVQTMEGEAALWRAADSLLTFLEGTGRKNVLMRRPGRNRVRDAQPGLGRGRRLTLIHGNGLRPAGGLAAIQAIRAMPAWQADDPWLPYQPRPRWNTGPLGELNRFQTPLVNWTINSGFKKAFFSRVAEITGYLGKTVQA